MRFLSISSNFQNKISKLNSVFISIELKKTRIDVSNKIISKLIKDTIRKIKLINTNK